MKHQNILKHERELALAKRRLAAAVYEASIEETDANCGGGEELDLAYYLNEGVAARKAAREELFKRLRETYPGGSAAANKHIEEERTKAERLGSLLPIRITVTCPQCGTMSLNR